MDLGMNYRHFLIMFGKFLKRISCLKFLIKAVKMGNIFVAVECCVNLR